MDNKFPNNHFGLFGNIVKQSQGAPAPDGLTKTFNVEVDNQYGIPLDLTKNGCGVVYFDGTDFQNQPYTIQADLQLKYTFTPIKVMLDGEFTIDSDNKTHSRLNAYTIVPVKSGKGPGNGQVIRPGTIVSVNGNIVASGIYQATKDDWFVRYVTAVYKNNSCKVAFKDRLDKNQELPNKFTTNSPTGTATIPNPSSALWDTSKIISDFTVVGNGHQTILAHAHGNNNLPVHVEDGDCVVQVALPHGGNTQDDSAPNGSHALNTESQVSIMYIPD